MSSFDVLIPMYLYLYPPGQRAFFASSYYLLCFAFALYFAITCICRTSIMKEACYMYAWMNGDLVYEG